MHLPATNRGTKISPLPDPHFFLLRHRASSQAGGQANEDSSDGKRNEIRGAPGGRTRYPMTMRKIRLDAAIATRAGNQKDGDIVEYY